MMVLTLQLDFVFLRSLSSQILAEISPTPTVVEIIDNSDGQCDGGAKLQVLVVSDAFDQLPPLKRHRIINNCLKEYLTTDIHALSLQCYTVAQYESKK